MKRYFNASVLLPITVWLIAWLATSYWVHNTKNNEEFMNGNISKQLDIFQNCQDSISINYERISVNCNFKY